MSESNRKYGVQVDWSTVVPLGDTLAIGTGGGFDDRWVEALQVVLEENQRQATNRKWSGIDFEHSSAEQEARFVLYVRKIRPGVRPFELHRTIDEIVKAANTVAQVGTHVYELARELRQTHPAPPRQSTPPPPFDPLADELDADAA